MIYTVLNAIKMLCKGTQKRKLYKLGGLNSNIYKSNSEGRGAVNTNKNIILSIINLATKEIAGVASLASNFGSGIRKLFSENYYEGVKVVENPEGINFPF